MSDQPPPPPPPPPPDQPGVDPAAASQLTPVGPWPRLGARIIDGLVLFVPNLIIAAILTDGDGSGFTGIGTDDNLLYLFVTTFVGYGYAVWLEAARGQTVGKMAIGIKVIGPDGRVPATDVAARRNAWLLLSLIPILGGILSFIAAIAIGVTINSDPFNRGVHDNFAGGSAVVRAR